MSVGPSSRVRPATIDDVGGLAELEKASFADPWPPASLTGELGTPGRIVRVALASEAIVGWSSTSVVADTADLLRVAVAPAARRLGLGRVLVDDVMACVSAAGAERVLLEVAESNAAARALYATTGFREIHRRRRYYADGADALVLERVLA